MAKGSSDHQYYAYLAERIAEGDENAFAVMYERTYKDLYRYVYYFLKDHDQVPDVMQEVYIAIYKHISTLKMKRLFVSWMKQIAYHVCCDYVRRMRGNREDAVDFAENSMMANLAAQSEEDCFQTIYDRELLDRVRTVLDKLPVKVRQAFVLRYGHDLKLEEVADFMDVSLASAKRYIHTAKAALQKELTEQYQS